MRRIGMVLGVLADRIDEYRKLHAAVWPEILELLHRHQIRNYSIFLKDETLFAYMEYHGEDFESDIRRLGSYEVMQRWYALCSPCQQPLASRKPGEWWAQMEQVFFMD